MTGTVPIQCITPSPVPRKAPRLGFVGVGWIGRHRLQAIAESGIARVAAVHDLDFSRAEEVAASVGAGQASSIEELLSLDLDGVVIATPNAFHAEQAIAALRRGKAVFCQKPLGRSAQETRNIIEAGRESDRLLGADFSYRHTIGMQALRQLVAGGELGNIYAAEVIFHNAYGPDKQWFYDPRLSGGGCVMDLGIHLIDLALWVLGFPEVESVFSRLHSGGCRIAGREQIEDYASAVIDLANGITVSLGCSWNLPAGRDAVIAVTFYGTRGGGRFRNVNGSFYDFTVERFRGTSRETVCSPPDAWGGRALVAWAERLSYSNKFDEQAMELVRVAEIIDRIYAG